MKKLFLLTKTLLAVALLCVGQNAWADNFDATLEHTASVKWGSNKGANSLDAEQEYFNLDNGSGWAGAAFAQFSLSSLSIPEGKGITSAVLTWKGTSGKGYGSKLYYLNIGQTFDFSAPATEGTQAQYTDNKTIIDNNVQSLSSSPTINTDVTAAIKNVVESEQDYIIFQWTANQGGANLYGKASANAPTLTVTFAPILNTPTATPQTSLTQSGDYYYKKYTLNCDVSDLEGEVEVSYKYSTDNSTWNDVDGNELLVVGTYYIKAVAEGYADSKSLEVEGVKYYLTSSYNFKTNGDAIFNSEGSTKYYYTNGLYFDAKPTLGGSNGNKYLSEANTTKMGVANPLNGQIANYREWTDNNYISYSNNKIEWSFYKSSSSNTHRLQYVYVYTPESLVATASDVTVTDGVVDLTGRVVYEGNLTEIKTAIAALEGIKTIKVGQVGCAVTAAQLNGLIPTAATNTIFIQLPENSYYEVATDVANLRTNAGTVALYALADANDYAVASGFTAISATYDRSFNKDIASTICLPFAIDNSDGTLGTFYQLKNTTTTETVIFEEVTTTEALKPYLFVPATTGTITIPENTAFAAATTPTSTTINNVTFNGSIASSEISSQIYGFKADGTFVTASDGTMNPFRAYLTTSLGSGARLARWSLGEITDVDGVKVNVKQEEVHIYNLQGQEVKSPRKGNVYIMNGKKVIF